ncbi:WhiB family transcriptional regulator, partial [Mycobacterium stomatepiae]|nr:WhiB family transcriptional regulator [Mycobacterium stomatepiae]
MATDAVLAAGDFVKIDFGALVAGYHSDMTRTFAATAARLQCLRRCPLAQQRRCAALAVECREEYGVWAGVKLPGGQYRKRAELARAHAV